MKKMIFRCPTFKPYKDAPPCMKPILEIYWAHSGQEVEVLWHVKRHKSAPVYRIRATDGWEGFVYKDELSPSCSSR